MGNDSWISLKMQYLTIAKICWNYNYGKKIYHSHGAQRGSNYQHCKVKMQTAAFNSSHKWAQLLMDWFGHSFIRSFTLAARWFPVVTFRHQPLQLQNLSRCHTAVTRSILSQDTYLKFWQALSDHKWPRRKSRGAQSPRGVFPGSGGGCVIPGPTAVCLSPWHTQTRGPPVHGNRSQAASPQLWGRLPDLDRKRAGENVGQTLPESGKCNTSQTQSLFRNGRLKPLQFIYSRPHSDKTFLSHIVHYRLNCVFPSSYTETPTPQQLGMSLFGDGPL